MRNLMAIGEPERTEVALAGFLQRREEIRALLSGLDRQGGRLGSRPDGNG